VTQRTPERPNADDLPPAPERNGKERDARAQDTGAENAGAENAGAQDADVQEAKAAAREAIGKLLGDDRAVRDGRSDQHDAEAARGKAAPASTKTSETEQE